MIKLTPKLKDAAWHEAREFEALYLRGEAMARLLRFRNKGPGFHWYENSRQPFVAEIKERVMLAEPFWLRSEVRLQHGRTNDYPYRWRWTWTYDPNHNFFSRTK